MFFLKNQWCKKAKFGDENWCKKDHIIQSCPVLFSGENKNILTWFSILREIRKSFLHGNKLKLMVLYVALHILLYVQQKYNNVKNIRAPKKLLSYCLTFSAILSNFFLVTF